MAEGTREAASELNSADSIRPAAPSVRRKWWQAALLLFVVALLALVAFQMRLNGPLAASRVGAGQLAPDFELQTFDGQTLSLADLRGQVVVINFWASWCKPCEEEAADLENAWQTYRDRGVVFVGVAYVDTDTESRRYLERLQITYPNGPDLGTRISQRYRVRAVPETFVVDRTGNLASVYVGPVGPDWLRNAIEPLLAE
jgi:cytochrome c biogenesis protein CcmG, thiol:disulfide interchange protein DsbE